MERTFEQILQGLAEALAGLETVRNRDYLRDLQLELAELGRRHAELVERAAALSRRVAELEEKTAAVDRLVEDEQGLWRPGDEDPGPYCPACWHDDRKLILLWSPSSGGPRACPRCGGRP
ncbi:MAG: hypothetical protein D6738_15105 [Acidobacteria bacterium]|nr:MAG: hypothetical protein D6738_15105 [Acidobacteriota bacterium]